MANGSPVNVTYINEATQPSGFTCTPDRGTALRGAAQTYRFSSRYGACACALRQYLLIFIKVLGRILLLIGPRHMGHVECIHAQPYLANRKMRLMG